MAGWTNEAGEPTMSGEAWRTEQALDMREPPYDPDDYLAHDEDDEDDEERLSPKLEASLARGLQQSAEGKTVDLGDFTQYTDRADTRKTKEQLYGALVTLCADYGYTTNTTYTHLHAAIDSIRQGGTRSEDEVRARLSEVDEVLASETPMSSGLHVAFLRERHTLRWILNEEADQTMEDKQ